MPQNLPLTRLATAHQHARSGLRRDLQPRRHTRLCTDQPRLQCPQSRRQHRSQPQEPLGRRLFRDIPFLDLGSRNRPRHPLQRRRSSPRHSLSPSPEAPLRPPAPPVWYSATYPDNFLSARTAATFIFDNLNGTISGWNGGAGTTAAGNGHDGGCHLHRSRVRLRRRLKLPLCGEFRPRRPN